MASGGKREGAGRPKGQRNKLTADVKVIAQSYGEEAIDLLAEIMRDQKAPHAARVAATKEILDRGYGKAHQSLDHTSSDGSMTPAKAAREMSDEELMAIAHGNHTARSRQGAAGT